MKSIKLIIFFVAVSLIGCNIIDFEKPINEESKEETLALGEFLDD